MRSIARRDESGYRADAESTEVHWFDQPDLEPSDEQLRAIEAEWPQIDAELQILNYFLAVLVIKDQLAKRRVRRMVRRILAGHTCTGTAGRLVGTGVAA